MSDYQHSGVIIAKRWTRIEAEYGEPIRNIILGMREQGYLWKTIAGALDITERQLITWRVLLDIPLNVRDHKVDMELHKPRKRDLAARAKGYADIEDAIRELRAKQWTYRQIGDYLGLHEQTICAAVPEELRGQLFPPERMAKLREHAKRVFAGRRGNQRHPWRNDERARVRA